MEARSPDTPTSRQDDEATDSATLGTQASRKLKIVSSGFQQSSTEIVGPTSGDIDVPVEVSSSTLRRRLVLGDVLSVILGFAAAFAAQAAFDPMPWSVVSGHALVAVVSLPGFAAGAGFNHLYQARANERRLEEAANILKAVGVGISMMLIVSLAFEYDALSRLWVGSVAVALTGSLLIERRIARSMFARLRREGRMLRRIVIVGTDEHAIGLQRMYELNPAFGYKVVGFVGDPTVGEDGSVDVLGSIEDVCDLLDDCRAVGVVVSLASVPSDAVNVMTRRLTDEGYHVALSSSLRDIAVNRLRPQTLDGRTMIYVEPASRAGWRASAKRLFDVSLALALMVFTLPIQFVAAISIASTSRGPVFFRQIRVGRDGELFEVLKFRTMYCDAEERKAGLAAQNEADGPLFKMTNDPRVTRVGRILRKFSIDELPQLFCVLIGSMSMVGPRPALPSEVEHWEDGVSERLRVPPGLTGLWQVSGRSDSSFEHYKRMDLYYVDNWSLVHDLEICLRTVGVVLGARGAR